MPSYKVTDPTTNKSVTLTGDSPPTEQELNDIFTQVHGDSSSLDYSSLKNLGQSALNLPSVQRLGQAITQGPSEMMQTIPAMASDLASQGSNLAQQQMQQAGVNPTVSDVASGAMKYAPDIMQLAASPINEAPQAIKAAIQPMSRALGLKAAERGTPFARGQVYKAAETALNEKIMPTLANPQGALDNATNLKNMAGEQLGEIRNIPAKIDSIFNGLDQFRQQITEGARTGYESVHGAIDNAQNKLIGLLEKGRDLTLNDIEGVKTSISESLNYLKDAPGDQKLNKQIVANIESGVEDLLGKSGADKAAYKSIKAKFGAAKLMMKGLNKEIGMQEGNNANGLLGIAGGAAELVQGNPLEAGATMGMMDLLKRRGWGLTANTINAAGNNGARIGLAASLGLNKAKNNQ